MLRGYLTGGLSGLIVSAVGLGTASLIAPQPAGNQPPLRPVVESPDLADAAAATEAGGVLPEVTADAGGAPAPSETPEVTVVDAGTPAVQTDTTPLEQPNTAEVTSGLASPQAADDPVVGVSVDAPIDGTEVGSSPAVPDNEADIVLETTTPPPPEVIVVDEVAEDAPESDPVVVVVVDEEAGDVPDVEDVADIGEAVSPGNVTLPETSAEADIVAGQDAVLVPGADTVGEVLEESSDGDGSDALAMADTESGEDPSAAPVMVAPEVDATLPVIPSTDDTAGEGSIISLQGEDARLPGQEAVRIIPTEDSADEAGAEEALETEDMAPASALGAYAADFELPEATPSMSVILVDDGALSDGAAAVAGLPFAVTVALDPTAAGAAEKMAAYRAAGVEVMAMASVPAGAQATDVEVALQAGFATLPETIGLLDIGQAGLQTDRALAGQAMARLAADGRGFATLSQGLNSGLRAADEADVPAVAIYRDLDSNDQDARVIRRFLDQAAFRARQQGSVVLVARVRADTISALVLWHTANAGGEVVMAPVSAVLLAGQG